MRRRSLLLAAGAGAILNARAQGDAEQSYATIGSGPFQFPIPGRYRVRREEGATIYKGGDPAREYAVAHYESRAPGAATDPAGQIDKLERFVRGNWERFVSEQRGKVVVPFERSTIGKLALFSMASEFTIDGKRTGYVQFAVTDGPRMATLFAEADRAAPPLLAELGPLVRRVVVRGE